VKEIAYSRAAVRTLARMPRNLADRIRGRIRAYAEDPASQAANVRRLRGPGRFLRLRVGDWRIVMRDADTLEILHNATRGHAYRD
jgi:mRNA interferase RelE/StbE